MKDDEKIKYLKDKGFKNGDRVSFEVENQISGCYIGGTEGVLHLDENPFIRTDRGFNILINEYLGAYIGTIKHEVLTNPFVIIDGKKCILPIMELPK